MVSGTVARISPLRTTFLDDNAQAVTLPNKLLTDLIITNYGDTSLLRKVCRTDRAVMNCMRYRMTLTQTMVIRQCKYA